MKNVILVSILLISSMFIASCSDVNGANNGSGTAIDSNSFVKPQERPDISGTINSITGNEIIVSKMILPDNGSGSTLPNDRQNSGQGNEGQNQRNFGGADGGMPGGMAGGGGFGGQGGNGQNSGQKPKFKTENVKVTIPVGITIVEGKRSSGKQMDYIEGSLSNIAIGQRVTIWTDKTIKDQNVANTVIFSKVQQQQSQTQN